MGVAQMDIEKIIENVSVLRQTLQAGSNNNNNNNNIATTNNLNLNHNLNHTNNTYKSNYMSVTTAHDHQSVDNNIVNNNCKIESMMPNSTNNKPTRRTVSRFLTDKIF
jgi:hypothetical protein